MPKAPSTRVQLDADQKKKMDTLSREVHSRIEEMAKIMAKSLGLELGSGVNVRFAPKNAGAAATGGRQIEIIDLPDGTYACYDSEPGICIYPCA